MISLVVVSKPKLKAYHREAIFSWIEENPQDLDYAVYKVAQQFGLRVSRWTIQRFLKSQGYTWRRVRSSLPKQEESDIGEKNVRTETA